MARERIQTRWELAAKREEEATAADAVPGAADAAEPRGVEVSAAGGEPAEPETPAGGEATATAEEGSGRAMDWVDNIKESIPVEVLAVWPIVAGYVDADPGFPDRWYWLIFGVALVATGLHVYQNILLEGTEVSRKFRRFLRRVRRSDAGRDEEPSDRIDVQGVFARWSAVVQVGIACAAFTVWVYYLGGPWLRAGAHNETLAVILLPLVVLVGPQLFEMYVWLAATTELRIRGALAEIKRALGRFTRAVT